MSVSCEEAELSGLSTGSTFNPVFSARDCLVLIESFEPSGTGLAKTTTRAEKIITKFLNIGEFLGSNKEFLLGMREIEDTYTIIINSNIEICIKKPP